MKKKQSEWDEMRLQGWLSYVHRFVMFITFPFRRFWLFLGIVITIAGVILAIPLAKGVRFSEIWDWYKVKMPTHEFVAIKEKAAFTVQEKTEKIKHTFKDILPPKKAVKEPQKEAQKTKLVGWNVAEFKTAEYKAKSPFVKAEAAKPKSTEDDEDLSQFYRRIKNLKLTYLNEPEHCAGTADVLGPNSLYINNKFIYLYGIYSDEEKYDVDEAQKFLQEMVTDVDVHCEIVAYTATGAGTALCFVGGVLINSAMVERGLAANVALKQR